VEKEKKEEFLGKPEKKVVALGGRNFGIKAYLTVRSQEGRLLVEPNY